MATISTSKTAAYLKSGLDKKKTGVLGGIWTILGSFSSASTLCKKEAKPSAALNSCFTE
ncbi:MAG: hypothetical protein IPL20_02245 [Saprospiraceae bacterium]|nr:hypothetical protein [Saprospiraceae bacterium]